MMDTQRFKDIWQMTWPQILLLLCQFVIGLTDVWTAGRMGGDVQAVIALVAQIQVLLTTIAFAGSNGTVASISQSLGANRPARAARFSWMAILFAVAISVLLTLCGIVWRYGFLALLNTPEGILADASAYLCVALLSMPGQYIITMSSAVSRATKCVIRPLLVSVFSCIANVFGDLAFGLGMWGFPNLGPMGIAISTTVSLSAGALLMLWVLAKINMLPIKNIPSIKWIMKAGRYWFKVSVPAFGTSFLWNAGYMVLYALTAALPANGISGVAGLSAGLRVEALTFMPGAAFSMTASILVGHLLGAGKEKEARRMAWTILAIGFVVISAITAAMWPFRVEIASWLSIDEAVQADTANYLFYGLLSAPPTVLSVILTGVFNGAGASIYPMIICSVSIWAVRLPMAWVLGHIVMGTASGIYAAIFYSQAIQAILLIWVALRPRWTTFVMTGRPAN